FVEATVTKGLVAIATKPAALARVHHVGHRARVGPGPIRHGPAIAREGDIGRGVQVSPPGVHGRDVGDSDISRCNTGPLVDPGIDGGSACVDAAVRGGEGSCGHVLPTRGTDREK
ncbi:MAG TPA: hypothetical protein VGG33_05480, partial [Polyangia bacterium]